MRRIGRVAFVLVFVGAACSLADYTLVSEGFTASVAPASVILDVPADGATSAIAVVITPGARFTEPVTVTLENAAGVVSSPIVISPMEAGTWMGTLAIAADLDASTPGFVNATVHATSGTFTSDNLVTIRFGKLLAKTDLTGCFVGGPPGPAAPAPCAFRVPADVDAITFILVGGGGGGGAGTQQGSSTQACQSPPVGGNGGNGGAVVATIRVTPGQTLALFAGSGGAPGNQIVVNGNGDKFYGAGGGGGGLSGIFDEAGVPLAIAGGGGGGGGGACAMQVAYDGLAGGSGSGSKGAGGYPISFGGGGGGALDGGGANGPLCTSVSVPQIAASYLVGAGCTGAGAFDGGAKLDGGTLYCFAGGSPNGGAGFLLTGPNAMTGGGGGGAGWFGGGFGAGGCNWQGSGGGGGSGIVLAPVVPDAAFAALAPDAAAFGRGAGGLGDTPFAGKPGATGIVYVSLP